MHPEEPKNKRVALLWPSGHLDRCPPVPNLAAALARRGYDVHIYSARNRFSPEASVSEPRVRLFLMPGVQRQFNEPVVRMTLNFLRWVRPQIAHGDYKCVIGVGIRGLVVASRLKRMGLRVAYHSLELYPPHEVRSLKGRFFKAIERRANKEMDFTIVQDPMRAELLAKYNGVDVRSMVMLPVSPVGPAEVKRSSYLHETLGIPREKKIVLYAGTVDAPFSVAHELRAVAHLWPVDFVLVLHSNTVKGLPSVGDDRVCYSSAALPYAQIEKLMSSAWACMAMYKTAGDDNMHFIGLSSGKMSEALRYGVPVIASDLPMMDDLVRRTGCGVAVKYVSQVGDALKAIAADYSGYCARAVNCFDRELAQERYVQGVIAAIEG